MTATHRLYRSDPYRTTFEAEVIEQIEYEGQPAIVLDSTCFYPTSGGQPNDLGTLNGIHVLDVVEEGERIIHILAEPLDQTAVRGQIAWERRFDHMQQHTGQHILSQAFEREFKAHTLSFHLGRESSTIDVSLSTLDWGMAAQVENTANRIVMENRLITAQEYDEGQVDTALLRKIPQVHGRLRIVEIADFDWCACGGTHVRTAGEVGMIHISGWERRHGQVRVEFLCGWRAAHDYHSRTMIAQNLAETLSVSFSETPSAIGRLLDAQKASQRQIEDLRRRLLACELPTLVRQAESTGDLRVLCCALGGYDASNMRAIAQNITQEPGMVALLAVTDPSPQLCFACAEGVEADMGQLLRSALKPFGGKGGGNARLAQGGGIDVGQIALALDYARQQLGLTGASAGGIGCSES